MLFDKTYFLYIIKHIKQINITYVIFYKNTAIFVIVIYIYIHISYNI